MEKLWIKGPLFGSFSIQVYGQYQGAYSLRIAQGGKPFLKLALRRYIFKGRQQDFILSVSTGNVATIEKSVRISSLHQDLRDSYDAELLGPKELFAELSHRLDKLDKYFADKDSSKARHELEKFQEKIDQVRKETVKTELKKQKLPKHFISKDAYEILTEDVSILLKHLPLDKKGKGEKQSQRLQQKM